MPVVCRAAPRMNAHRMPSMLDVAAPTIRSRSSARPNRRSSGANDDVADRQARDHVLIRVRVEVRP